MKNKLLRTGLVLLCALGAGLPSIAVAAAPSQIEEISVAVSYADLDIEKEEDAKILYKRLVKAAKRACNLRSDRANRLLSSMRDGKACFDSALTAAIERIGSDEVAKLHAG